MKVKAKYANPNYDNAGATDEVKAKDHYIRPQDSKPAAYLPPACGAGIFFESVDVHLDGQDILKEVEVSSLQYVYQSLNRAFSTAAQRRRLGQETSIPSSKYDSDLGDGKTESMRAALTPLHNDSWKNGDTLYLEFGFDGLLFLSAPRNFALQSLQGGGVPNDNLALPPGKIHPVPHNNGKKNTDLRFLPGSCLEILLHKREPLNSAVEWPGITAASYFSTTADATDAVKKIDFAIEACGLCYESTVLASGSKIAADLRKSSLTLHFDIPKISYQALLPSQQRLNLNVMIPSGSKCAYVFFMFGHQLWQSDVQKKHLSGRVSFPSSLQRAFFSIPGHESVAFKTGFAGVGAGSFSSETCRTYFNDLRSQGVIDCNLEDMFPRVKTEKSYMQAFFLDLRPFRIRTAQTLFVELEFDANLSPRQTYLVSNFVCELSLARSRGLWQSKVTDG